MDVLVLVDDEKNWNNREKLSDITFDINLEYDTQLTCLLGNSKKRESEDGNIWLPLKDNIIQEGIASEDIIKHLSLCSRKGGRSLL
ncbi:hypothetical protein SAMN02799630_00862 [Paenibacillus sp. UNCCL117]|nr:hypothetical protein SAMN04488602_101662 [Paenibacillus sp. cl123]SFW19224.1 hypothetical protein SAMN02799630_00862 [Paenibacillus sp. UNCCL117]